MKENNNSKSSNYKIYIAIGIALVILIIGFYLYYFYPQLIPGMASTALKGDINVIAIGLDDLESVKKGEINADALVLFKLKPDNKELEVVNVITDKRALNMETYQEDVKTILEEIGRITSTDINYYITVSYQGFIHLIDNLDGIDLTLEEKIEVPDLGLDLKAGINTLSGEKVLNYTRWYDYTKDEEERIKRQQQVLKAIIEKTYKGANLFDLPQLFKTIIDTYNTVETNIDYTLISDIVEFLGKNKDLEVSYSIVSVDEN